MKSIFWKFSLCAFGTCAGALLAQAAPLQRAEVIANPAYLVHVDCDSLRTTVIGQHVLEQLDRPDVKPKLAALQAIFSIDFRNQLHGVTLYGSTQAPKDGVLIVYADFDPARLLVLAQAATDYRSEPHGKHVIHSWLDDGKEKKTDDDAKPRIYASVEGNRVIFAKREEAVSTALDVLDGAVPNLAGNKLFPSLGVAGNTDFLEAAGTKLLLPTQDPNAAVLKLAQSIQLTLGEQDKTARGTLTLIAQNEDVAGHILAIAQGILALTKLQNDKPELSQVVNALAITQDGTTVQAVLTLPAADVVTFAKADEARKAAEKARKEHDADKADDTGTTPSK
jgi:hypothetical protein